MPGPCDVPARPYLQPVGQPGREQVGARADPLGGDRRRLHLQVLLVERGRQQRPPRGQPGPGQVGGARCVRRAEPVQRRRPPGAYGGGVGDPALRQGADRVGRRVVGVVAGPPDDDRGVRQQQRHHDRLGVLDHLAGQPDQGDLAGPAVADPDLGVDRRLAAAGAEDQRRAPAPGARARPCGRSRARPWRSSSSATMTIVITMPCAGLPCRVRCSTNALRSRGVGVQELDVGRRWSSISCLYHGRRHVLPSRASILWADSGPQVPDS